MIPAGSISTLKAAEILGVTKALVLRWIGAGRIAVLHEEPFPGGKRFWLRKSDVEQLAKELSKRRKG